MTKLQKNLIIAASIAIPVVVGILFRVKIEGVDLSFLPGVYAGINSLTAFSLIAALIFIRQKKIDKHELMIKTAMVLSLAFLVLYVAYHMTSDSTPYGGDGFLKYFYYFVLITHVFLSMIIVPLVLVSYVYGIGRNIEKHKKIVKFSFPLWLYVAISGVVVYLMISPYYG